MSVGLAGIEPVVDTLMSKLTAGLNAEIDLQNTDRPDDFTIAYPANIFDFLPPIDQVQEFPMVGILHGVGVFEDDTGFAATGKYELAVVVYVQEAEQQALVKKVRRYLRCITRTVMAGRNAPPNIWGITLVREYYGPALEQPHPPNTPPASWYTFAYAMFEFKQDDL